MKVECESCQKNVLNRLAYSVSVGVVGVGDGWAGHTDSTYTAREIRGDGMFCSFKCLKAWINCQKALTPPKDTVQDEKASLAKR